MSTFGKTTIGATTDNNGSGDLKFACRFQCPENGYIDAIVAYIRSNSIGVTTNVRGGIYDDNVGAPNNLIGQSVPQNIDHNPAWRTFILGGQALTALAYYWLGVIWETSLKYEYDAGVANQGVEDSDTYSDGFSNPYGGVPTYAAKDISIYAVYRTALGGAYLSKINRFNRVAGSGLQ